ncbi:hypothetical protein PVA98_04185, partial [Achromobacter xylosoxidans]|nr:hypothetical protein [Achromobacter xylosoxidans]
MPPHRACGIARVTASARLARGAAPPPPPPGGRGGGGGGEQRGGVGADADEGRLAEAGQAAH